MTSGYSLPRVVLNKIIWHLGSFQCIFTLSFLLAVKENKSWPERGDSLHTFTSLQGLCTPLTVSSGCWSSSVKGKHSVYPRIYSPTWKFMVRVVNTVNLFCHHISQVLFLGLCPSKPCISELNLLDKQNRQFSTTVTLSIAILFCIHERQVCRSSWNYKTVLDQDWWKSHRQIELHHSEQIYRKGLGTQWEKTKRIHFAEAFKQILAW